MQTLTACPVCNSGNFHEYLEMKDSWGKYSLCECGAAFLNPRMDNAELREFYATGAYRKHTEEMDAGHADALRQQKARAQSIKVLLGKFQVHSHLDIGCSTGELLRVVGAERAVGVDPDPVLTGNGFTLAPSLADVEGEFDLITVIHTLEHVNEPLPFMSALFPHLRPNGLLIVEVPNRRAWLGAYSCPQHVIAYDVLSLKRALSVFRISHTILHGMPDGSPLDLNITMLATR